MAGADASKKDIKHRFEITGKLGSGTYGKVSLAYDHKVTFNIAGNFFGEFMPLDGKGGCCQTDQKERN